MKHFFYIINFIISMFVFASCKDEMEDAEDRPSRNDGLTIGFTTEQEGFEKPTTRGPITEIKGLDYVRVLGMKQNGGDWTPVFSDASGKDVNPLRLNRNGQTTNGLIWEYSPKAKWIEDYNYKFRAFFPEKDKIEATKKSTTRPYNGTDLIIPSTNMTKATCDNGGFTYTLGSTKLTLKNYTSHPNPSSNIDLMVSQTIKRCNNTDVVALNMKHLLACVDFKAKFNWGRRYEIRKFTINGHAENADCIIDEDSDDPQWIVKYEDSNIDTISWYKEQNKNEVKYYQRYVFRDKQTEKDLTFEEMKSRILGSNEDKHSYYILPGVSSSLGSITIKGTEKNENTAQNLFTGLLFIPQQIDRGDAMMDVFFNYYEYNKYGAWNLFGSSVKIENVLIKRSVYAEMEFYIAGEGDAEHTIKAIIDLSAGGAVKKWEAGKRYTYNISMNNLTEVNVEIEDWQTHTINEKLQ